MSYLLFFIYLGVFCWLLTKIKFFKDSGIEMRLIIILFLIRIASGIINGYINLYYYIGTDASFFHQQGLNEYRLLFENPGAYFTNIFLSEKPNSGLFDITNSYWNNLRSFLMIKLLSVFNVFSCGDFFINTIFYNFLTFFGSFLFYKVFIKIFPYKPKVLIAGLFLLPSLLYFSAGIHKDGLIFLALGIGCYNIYFLIKEEFSISKMIWVIFSLIIIFLLRNFVLITLLPAIIAWIIAEKNKRFIFQTFAGVYLLFIVLFFTLGSIHPSLDLPKYVSERQIAFVEISKLGQSSITINPLFPNFTSFLKNTPQALNHSLMRPYLTENYTLLYIPVAIEIFIYQVLLVVFLFFRKKNIKHEPFIYFCVFFSLSIFLMIGYTIPIIGALVRYRSIYFPFLLIPIMCYTNWHKVGMFLHFKK